MGFMDNVKKAAEQARHQAAELAGKHGSTIDQAVHKAGSAVDQRTGGRYSDKITKAQQAARAAREKVAGQEHPGHPARPSDGTVPPQGQTPPPPPPGPAAPPPPPGQGSPPPPPPGPAAPPPSDTA